MVTPCMAQWTTDPSVYAPSRPPPEDRPFATSSGEPLVFGSERDRGQGSSDLHARRINPDGTLGGPTLCPDDFNRSGAVSAHDIAGFLAACFSVRC